MLRDMIIRRGRASCLSSVGCACHQSQGSCSEVIVRLQFYLTGSVSSARRIRPKTMELTTGESYTKFFIPEVSVILLW